MEIVDSRCTLITNQEVLEMLVQAKKQQGSSKETSKQSDLKQRDVNNEYSASQNHNTIVYETMKYLNETTNAGHQTRKQVVELIKALQKFKLTAAELMQIVNLRPKNPIQLQLVVEESEERFSEEQVDDMVRLIADYSRTHSSKGRTLRSPKSEMKT